MWYLQLVKCDISTHVIERFVQNVVNYGQRIEKLEISLDSWVARDLVKIRSLTLREPTFYMRQDRIGILLRNNVFSGPEII